MLLHLNCGIKKRSIVGWNNILVLFLTRVKLQLSLFLLDSDRGIRIILGLQLLFSRRCFCPPQTKTRKLLSNSSCAASRRRIWIWVEIIGLWLTSLSFDGSACFEFTNFDWVYWRANTHPVILIWLLRVKPNFAILLAEDVVCDRKTVWRFTVSTHTSFSLRQESTSGERHVCTDSTLAVFPPQSLKFKTLSGAFILKLEFNLLTLQYFWIVQTTLHTCTKSRRRFNESLCDWLIELADGLPLFRTPSIQMIEHLLSISI